MTATTTTDGRNRAPAEPPEQPGTLRNRIDPALLAPGAFATTTFLLSWVINHRSGRTILPLGQLGSRQA